MQYGDILGRLISLETIYSHYLLNGPEIHMCLPDNFSCQHLWTNCHVELYIHVKEPYLSIAEINKSISAKVQVLEH
jgi:hypothetical protein